MPVNGKQKYLEQRSQARHRKIPFLLTFDQWWHIWQFSGHWSERGRTKGKYVMARFGDVGPYAVGNVKIILMEENTIEAHTGRTMSAEHRSAILVGFRKKFPAKQQIFCQCGCGVLAVAGNRYIHGHAGIARFRQIAQERIGKPRTW